MWYKKLLILALAIFGVLCSGYAQTRSINSITYEKVDTKWYQQYNGNQYEVDESVVTVKFISGLNESQKITVAQNNNCTILRSNSLGYYDLQVNANRAAVDVVGDLSADSSIEFAEPNTIGEFVVHANDTYYWDQWHLHHPTAGIDAYKAWDKENGDPNVAIGILDSGTDILHEDLEGNIWVNPGEDLDGDGVVWDSHDMNGIDDDGNGLIDDLSGWDFENNNNDLPGPYYHGTHVAGIAGAETNDAQGIAGVAGGWTSSDNGCSLLIGAVGGNYPVGSVLDDAILYAVDEGAKVITMSLTVGFSQAIVDAINAAYNSGVFVDNASGNNGSSSLPFPANVEHCFAVGASNQSSLKEGFSNHGDGLMVVAPGVDIKSTRKDNTYGTGSGTSYASPQVAGTAGLIASRHTDFNAQDIEKVICLTAKKLSAYIFTDGYEYGSWNYDVGYGLLNADRAIGIKGNITSNMTLEEGNYIRDEVHITNNSTLTINTNSRFYLLKTGKLYVDAGATLIIEDSVTISGNTSNKIIVNGDIQVGNNVHFNRLGSSGYFAGLDIINQNTTTILNQVTFTKTRMHNYGKNLIVHDCDFDDCYIIYSHRGTVTFTMSDFDRTWLYLENINVNNYAATVADCNFTTDITMAAIDLWNYDNYRIENNTISGYYNGIQLCQSGDGNIINYHHIHNNEISECNMTGITIYDSKVSISQNNVHDNMYGIRLNNNSNTALYGAYNAPSYNEMNQIRDNDSYELYISKYSYPWYFRYNAIIDEDNAGNPSDPLLYFAYPAIGKINQKDIRYNCWGDNFDADEDLYPSAYFYYTPTWCPGGSPIPIDEAEQLYTDGIEQFEAEQYNESKETFLMLIEQFPKTQYAVSAMKELVVLEKFASNDYATLKNYYQTDEGIQTDTTLQKLSSSLSNKCDIKLENWSEAISHYENIILAPETIEDSIFAIIDLGYVYFLMENDGNKSTYSGQLTEFIPKSKEGFFGHRDYLLSLLPGDQISETMKGDIATLKEGELLQNVPNPFNGTTQIWYKLKTESNVQLKVYNSTGQLISTINEGPKTTGTHHINFDANGLKNGIYFYTISINGQLSDTKKMVVK